MNNYLELKKEQVRYWSKIGALVLASLPLISSLRAKKVNDPLLKTLDKAVWTLLILLALITYFTTYYTLTSLFWPEPLSITNHLLLIPCLVLTGISVYEIISDYSIYERNKE